MLEMFDNAFHEIDYRRDALMSRQGVDGTDFLLNKACG